MAKVAPVEFAKALQQIISKAGDDFAHLRPEVNKEVSYRSPGSAQKTVKSAPVAIYLPTMDDADALGREGDKRHPLRAQITKAAQQAGYKPEYFGPQYLAFL